MPQFEVLYLRNSSTLTCNNIIQGFHSTLASNVLFRQSFMLFWYLKQIPVFLFSWVLFFCILRWQSFCFRNFKEKSSVPTFFLKLYESTKLVVSNFGGMVTRSSLFINQDKNSSWLFRRAHCRFFLWLKKKPKGYFFLYSDLVASCPSLGTSINLSKK